MKEYLYDKEFLKKIDYHQEKDIYAKVALLDNNDSPKQVFEGRVTGGSINVDGASAIRRSCSLNLLVTNEDVVDNNSYLNDKYWSYNNKFRLEIGIKNLVDDKYPEILWFDQGVYIISSFTSSKSVSNISVSIQGKDKMCRLNGEISGNIPIETDFGTIETIDNKGNSTITKLPLYTIIQQAVKEYGGERIENIVINDLDFSAYELWEYRGGNPMYLILDYNNRSVPKVLSINFDGNTRIYKLAQWNEQNQQYEPIEYNGFLTFGNFSDPANKLQYYTFNTLDKTYNNNATVIWLYDRACLLAKIEYGETAGYHQMEDLVYNSDLILKAGETVTSLLDKIKNMLGGFEYFYDLQGRFVFQRKQTYVEELFSPIDGELVTPIMHTTPYSYEFKDYKLFTAISSPPNIANTKNDFTIWGSRKSISGVDLPIHVRYAINKKPITYKSLQSNKTYTNEEYDWRELIYQMAKDYYKLNSSSSYLIDLENNNPWCTKGKTGYEQYYSDIMGFWRQLYNPNPTAAEIESLGEFYSASGSDGQGANKYWNKKIHTDPNSLNFWFDFLDVKGEINNYNIDKIGVRTKVVNENSVKSIYFKETPEILFIIPTVDKPFVGSTSRSLIQIQKNLVDMFSRSSQGIAATSKVNELIYQHTIGTETISITSIPIFYLEPNTRIYVQGYGDYTLDKISYSLNYNGTMNISGVKINKQFY